MNNLLLELKNVSKKYGSRHVLKDINLKIFEGEILSLLGVNGAGKTTLSSIIASLHPLSSGEILIDGKSIYKDVVSYRKMIGFCPQKPNFAADLTLKEHLMLAGRYFLMPITQIKSRVKHLLKQFELEQYASSSPSILSGGYKQRLLLARSIIHNPKLVILDEPTVALDPHIRHQLWDFIKKLKSEGVTILLTTHYLDEAEVLSDRICVLDKGLIRLIDTPSNLLASYKQSNLEDVFLELMKEE